MIKVILDNEEIKYFVVSAENGRILESGETENQDTWEDTYVDLNTVEVGRAPKISYNYSFFSRTTSKRKPVWVDLLYKVKSIEKTKKDKNGELV